ncbi:MAG: hypothetical protein LW875_00445 [Proteobacteria bacterium]|jgi:hypothetical protein|nr:hypothetical protein [Pseudomonadota bacterium]
MSQLVVGLLMIASLSVQAGLLYKYPQLALKDLDQMNKIVRSKIAESKKSGGDKVIPLKEAFQAVFSRPNDDLMIEKIVSPLKTELEEHDAYEDTVRALVKEAISALKNPKAFQPVVQVTYVVFLENIISEFRPKAGEEFEKSIIAQIRDAKIQLTKGARDERTLRMMKQNPSPSDIAAAILPYKEAPSTK